MKPTKLLYLEDFTTLSGKARVLEAKHEDGKDVVALDQTLFYPQGGGQPYDTGTIKGSSAEFAVNEVRFVDGVVRHMGEFTAGHFALGDVVTCDIDAERRFLHSRIHSAGHLVDLTVHALNLPWIPGKGYHFPDGPYVEYTGSLEGLEREQLKSDLESKCNALIEEDRPTTVRFVNKEEMQELCHFVPENIPTNKPSRVVLFGDFGVPCGGTHVASLRDLHHVTIRKVKPSGLIIRVGYQVEQSF